MLCLHRSSGTPRTAAVGAQSVSDGEGITGADARILQARYLGGVGEIVGDLGTFV